MYVLITLTTAGVDTGPFNLYSDADSYAAPFETGVAKSALVAGYGSSSVPGSATTIRVASTGTCTNYVDLGIAGITTTTTSTTATPNYKYYFEVLSPDGINLGGATFTLNSTGGGANFTTNYNLILSGSTTFNPSGSSVVSEAGKQIDRIEKIAYDGVTILNTATLNTPNYNFSTGPFTMNSTGTSPGQFQTIRVYMEFA
jgi:hypothetical protein